MTIQHTPDLPDPEAKIQQTRPSAVPTSAAAPAAPTTEAYSDPRALSTDPVPTEPPEDVATDESYRAPDGWADVALTFAEWDDSSASVQVNAFVGGLVEDGGTCTLTLTRGADTRTAAVPSSADAATTICPSMTVPGDQLGSGTWQARVTYSSATATGASQPVEVAVP
jgi:hypothetical protein